MEVFVANEKKNYNVAQKTYATAFIFTIFQQNCIIYIAVYIYANSICLE